MGCKTDEQLDNISLDCNDIPVGGIREIYIANACDVALGVQDKMEAGGSPNAQFGKVTTLGFRGASTAGSGKVYQIEFNKKDGTTSFTDAKTVESSGIVTVVPTLVVELPRMNGSKRKFLNEMSTGVGKYLVFLKTTAGTKHLLGAKFGMKVSEIAGTTGTGRTEKNTYKLTLVGEELELAYDLEDLWNNVVNKVSVTQSGASNVDVAADTDAFIPRKNCIPTPSTKASGGSAKR